MVKDFSWNIISWNALLFEKTLNQLSILDSENYGFILNTCHDTAKRAETRVGFPVIFSRLWRPIEPKFSQVFYFIYKLWQIHKVWAFEQYCLPKVSNGFKRWFRTEGIINHHLPWRANQTKFQSFCDVPYEGRFAGYIIQIQMNSFQI